MTLLAIDWGSIGIKTVQFILSFSILVVLHELGHYFPAKWFKCRVEKFYLFFNPWFSLWKKKIGGTEWGIGWVPFGGYVKIAGMVDESMDKEAMKLPPKPDEFRAKPAWQRLIIMVGGVTVNVILAIVIFIGIMWVWGEESLPGKNMKYGIVADSLGKTIGLKDGDIVLKVGDKPLRNGLKMGAEIGLSGANDITVLRDGNEMKLPFTSQLTRALNSKAGMQSFATIRVPFVAESFSKGSAGEKAGIKKGDRILGLDSVATPFFNDCLELTKTKAGKTVSVKLLRNGKDTMHINVPVSAEGKMGIYPSSDLPKLGFDVETKHYTFLQSIPRGFALCWESLDRYVMGIKQLFNGKAKASESLGSVFTIGSIFPDEWDWQTFWTLTALFSIILAFMNILPIPALDGGHALFCIIEIITGRKPSDKFMEIAQTVGMVLLLGLMVYAMGLDIWRFFR
jgi:regulator of sigma E protease